MALNSMELEMKKCQSLKELTTFRIGGIADILFQPETTPELVDTLQSMDLSKGIPVIIGNGSNILISSLGYRGMIISTSGLNRIEITNEDQTELSAEAGVKLPKLSKYTRDLLLTGAEFMAGIPGSAGGGTIMNCSAHGQSLAEIITGAEVFNLITKEYKTWSKDDLGLVYRGSSIDPERHLIVKTYFAFKKSSKEEIEDRVSRVIEFRSTRQPKGFNAGSVFKNPGNTPELSAGYLLDKAGVKGWCEGGAIVSNIHANFINNEDNATSVDVSRLMLRMFNAVKTQTGISIRPEIKFMGQPTEEEENIWKILKEG